MTNHPSSRPIEDLEDGVEIDLPSCEEIEEVLKYLKNNNVAGLKLYSAEMLKSSGSNFVDFLHELIQQRDYTRRLHQRGTVPGVSEMRQTQVCKREICLLIVAYKVFSIIKLVRDRQIENEYNIPTNHLFIDFKAANDTILRNEVYVSTLELAFSTFHCTVFALRF
jgi:hypothetical protein